MNPSAGEPIFDLGEIEAVSARLDLRRPNRDAVETLF